MNKDQHSFAEHKNVSRETFSLYEDWYNLLRRWNNKINLVSSSTVQNFWLRHALDSFQVAACAPSTAQHWLDMGSGGGFPGLAIAISLKEQGVKRGDAAGVVLVETNGKKCNFLRTVIRELDLPAKVKQVRVENLVLDNEETDDLDHKQNPLFGGRAPDVITARAFAPLVKLCEYSAPLQGVDTMCVFPKGRTWQDEVDAAKRDWSFDLQTQQSETDEEAKILILKNLTQKNTGVDNTRASNNE
jgi:16S rRNA (guanine527-N7)-methyltransferase